MSIFGIGKTAGAMLLSGLSRNPKTAMALGAVGISASGGWGKIFPHGLAYELSLIHI